MGDIPDVEFITFDKSAGLGAYRAVKEQLADRRFDIALCMHASMRANWLVRLLPTPHKVGFDKVRARDFQWLFTNHRVPAATHEHAIEAMMGFARFIGAGETTLRWDIPVSREDREFAAEHMGDRTVVISPCSTQRSRNFRNWAVENFVAVARYLRDRYAARILITGGSSDLERHYAAAIGADSGAVDLVDRTSLKQLFALTAVADMVICPDSGPAHIATAAGTPVVGLYATSNPDRTGPYLSRQHCVNRYPDAVNRYLGKSVDELRWGQRVRHPDAMALISIDDVVDKIDDIYRL